MKPTLTVDTRLYTDANARNWLAIHHCLITPTKLGTLEIAFPSEQIQLDFCLRFAEYACNPSTT